MIPWRSSECSSTTRIRAFATPFPGALMSVGCASPTGAFFVLRGRAFNGLLSASVPSLGKRRPFINGLLHFVVKREALMKCDFYLNRYLISIKDWNRWIHSKAGLAYFLDQPSRNLVREVTTN